MRARAAIRILVPTPSVDATSARERSPGKREKPAETAERLQLIGMPPVGRQLAVTIDRGVAGGDVDARGGIRVAWFTHGRRGTIS